MCFSAEASLTAAALLIPTGAAAVLRAWERERSYAPIAALPIFFGLQQLAEGVVWIGNGRNDMQLVSQASLVYMFFSWLAWPVWVPFATFFLETCQRRYLYLIFAILGGMLGAVQYFPYFGHDGWLTTRFLPKAVVYEGRVMFDLIISRELTYAIYLFAIIAPLLTSSNRRINVFGLLISLVVLVVYLFFRYAYISVFCVGGAAMSIYLVYMVFVETGRPKGSHAAVSQ